MPPTIWIDGQYRDGASATVSVYDHGLLYGDGVFEGIRAYKRRVFRLQQHLDRLYASAKGIWLEIPMAKDALGGLVEEAVRKSGLEDAYIRLVVTRGAGDLGLDPRKCPKPSIILIVDEIHLWPADRYDKGLTALTAATPIGHRESLSPRIKSLNYLAHILAKVEGIAAGVDEVLMLGRGGYVAEASGMNLFVVMNGTIRTPPRLHRDPQGHHARRGHRAGPRRELRRRGAAPQPLRPLHRGRGLPHRHRRRNRGRVQAGCPHDRQGRAGPRHPRSVETVQGVSHAA